MNKTATLFAFLLALVAPALATTAPPRLTLKNDAMLRELEFDGHAWRTVRFARADGSDALKVASDEFHVPFLDDAEVREQVFDLPAGRLPLLKPVNEMRIVRERDGDKFKFRGLALAVQLADGTWVASTLDRAVQTSHRDWAHFEGQPFPTPRESHPVTLRF